MAAKRKELRDLRTKDLDEVRQLLVERRRELMELRFSHATGSLENSARLPQLKREVAQILTVINERRQPAVAAAE